MSNLGLGVMLQALGGSENTAKVFKNAIGKIIKRIKVDPEGNGGDGTLQIHFDDDTGIELFDRGRSCCERRYLHTDDNLQYFIGSKLLTGKVREGSTIEEDEWGEVHDVEFLVIATSKGVFTIETHNEHNGYYGGFWVVCQELSDKSS